MKRVEHGCHHGHRTEARIIQNLIMKLPVGGSAMDVQRDGDHVRLLAELTHDSCVPVLHECANCFGGIHNFERVQRRRNSRHHLSLRHWQIHHAELEQGMSACE